jgi:tyrosine-protein kinase Etk/Wzc
MVGNENNTFDPEKGVSSSPYEGVTHADDQDNEVSILDLLAIIAANLRLLIVGPLLVGLAALGLSFFITPTFTARTSFLPPHQQQSTASAVLSQLGALAGATASAAGLKNPADQYIALLKSTSIGDRLVDIFGLVALYDVKFRQDARKALSNNVRIFAGKDGLIVVEVDDESPQRAADIANAYVTELESLMGRLALTEAQNRRVFFEKQLEQTKIKLTAAELALGAIGVNASAIKANPAAAVEAVAQLQAQATAQEVLLAAMRNYLTESAPQYQQAQSELRALRAQLLKSGARQQVPTSEGGYIEKYRDFKYQETLFELFVRQFEMAKVDEAREGAAIQVVDRAFPPERKSSPKKARIAVVVTIVVGALLLLLVFARHALGTARDDPQQAAKLATIRAAFLRAVKPWR